MPFVNMSPSVIASQVVLTVLLLAAPYAKSRFGYLLMCALANFASLAVFVLNGDSAASLSLILINVRSLAYLYQARAKTDVIPFICLIAQAVALIPSFSSSVLTSPLSLLPMALTMYATAFMWWSKSMQHMRASTTWPRACPLLALPISPPLSCRSRPTWSDAVRMPTRTPSCRPARSSLQRKDVYARRLTLGKKNGAVPRDSGAAPFVFARRGATRR